MPDDETTRTLFDNLDFQRAVQAYLQGLAPVDMAVMRKALLAWGPANSTIVIWEDLVHPLFIGLVYNTSTSYGYAWLDLHGGPLVVEVPPRVYGGVDDHWCRWVVDVGLTGPDQAREAKVPVLASRVRRRGPGGLPRRQATQLRQLPGLSGVPARAR